MEIVIRQIKNEDEQEQVFAIRKQVFSIEQNVSEEIEFDMYEEEAKHFIVLRGSLPIGCARCRTINNSYKFERIAILKQYRKKGYGILLVNFLLEYAQQQNPIQMYLHAQTYLIKFYENLGFSIIGKEFEEDGIPHIKMIYKNNV